MTAPWADDAGNARPDRAADTSSADAVHPWALVEPLPTSGMLLAAFAGATPMTAIDILAPAAQLVSCHKRSRRAAATLRNRYATYERLKYAVAELVSSQEEMNSLIESIDAAVTERLKQHRRARRIGIRLSPAARRGIGPVVVHTETIGAIAARMAELWDVVAMQGPVLDELPEARRLMELRESYDCLASEIEAGRRLPPGS
jgi:hypothetical protein